MATKARRDTGQLSPVCRILTMDVHEATLVLTVESSDKSQHTVSATYQASPERNAAIAADAHPIAVTVRMVSQSADLLRTTECSYVATTSSGPVRTRISLDTCAALVEQGVHAVVLIDRSGHRATA